jgi:E3 ubiquitin-protein ligase EDD1
MIKVQEKALHAMRDGVFDVLPDGALDGLTSEDFRLLLNGVGDINVSVLISYTSFNDESGESTERLVKFKRWLWSIVEKMSHVERQDLVRICRFCPFKNTQIRNEIIFQLRQLIRLD